MIKTCEQCGGLYGTQRSDGTLAFAGTPCSCTPPDVTEVLRKFVDYIEGYETSGVWPDNYTLRQLANEGKRALIAVRE